MKICKTCLKQFKTYAIIDGKRITLYSRKNCLDCQPYGAKKQKQKEEREKIRICKECDKEFVGKYSKWSNGEYCSEHCAKKHSQKQFGGNKTKIVNCCICKKKIEVNIRASDKQCKCDKCKKYIKNINGNFILNRKKCKICGQEKCLRRDICKKYPLFPSLIKYFGFNKNKIGTINVYEEFDKVKNLVEKEYFENGLSSYDIACKYKNENIDKKQAGNFSKIIVSLGIKLRSLSESITNATVQGKNRGISYNQYKCGYHITWNNKQIFYRSSYELDYCKELDEKQIDYEVEKLRILYWDSQATKQRIAIPDFYLPETNEIVEIKSMWTYDEQNMKDKFKAYKEHGYKAKLILEHKEKVI